MSDSEDKLPFRENLNKALNNESEFISIFNISDQTIIFFLTLFIGVLFFIFLMPGFIRGFIKEELKQSNNLINLVKVIFFTILGSSWVFFVIGFWWFLIFSSWTLLFYYPFETIVVVGLPALIIIIIFYGYIKLTEYSEEMHTNSKNGEYNENRSSYSGFKISSNYIIIFLLLIIIAGGVYFISQNRQSNTEIRYIPKIINQYVPSFNSKPFNSGSSGIENKAPGNFMIEKGVEILSPKKPKTNKINPGFTKVCIKDGIGGKKSVTVGASRRCPLGYKELK